jgi:hypothetical protein
MNKIYMDGEHYSREQFKKAAISHFKTLTVGLIIGGLIGASFYHQNASSVPEIVKEYTCSPEQKAEIIQNRLVIALEGGSVLTPKPERKP